MKIFEDPAGGVFPYAWNLFKLFPGGACYPAHLLKMGEERSLPGFADSGDIVQHGAKILLFPDLAMVGYRETMGLIPDPLKEEERPRVFVKIKGIFSVRQIYPVPIPENRG